VGSRIEAAVASAVERLQWAAAQGGGALDVKKQLIDQQLVTMNGELRRVTTLVASLERDRAERYGELASQLRAANQQTAQLVDTTTNLREALVCARARGQWGERMAEDVLRLAGFVENVNYRRQRALAEERRVPDFTFLLPHDLVLHMDVKFPLDNYLRYLEARFDGERERHRTGFLRDVRQHIRELSDRGYIDPTTTVDCVLLFIPNEQLYAFVQEHDAGLLDEALRRKVVMCSPLTLFAVLAVIRQSLDQFALERRSSEILDALGRFGEQWRRYIEQMDKLGTHLDRAQHSYDELVRTRRRQLERPLERLDELRRRVPATGDGTPVEVSQRAPG
jgi:DNA recombination protein RmuC